jgi:hypothetical protein
VPMSKERIKPHFFTTPDAPDRREGVSGSEAGVAHRGELEVLALEARRLRLEALDLEAWRLKLEALELKSEAAMGSRGDLKDRRPDTPLAHEFLAGEAGRRVQGQLKHQG